MTITKTTNDDTSPFHSGRDLTITGYHFTGDCLRDGSAIPEVGVWLTWDGPVEPCRSGLHCCEHPFDALNYAPGVWLHKVELAGDLVSHGDPVDKWVGRRRKILTSVDAEELLREFARLWEPHEVVREYLSTGAGNLRSDASVAARDAARDAARCAAMSSARHAAKSAASDATWEYASYTEWSTCRDAIEQRQRSQFQAMVDKAFGDI